jgi:hypothetical protein
MSNWSIVRHKKEAYELPAHIYSFGLIFKRLEYLITHKQKCLKKVASTQTDPIADNSICTQTNFTMTNSVTNYVDILKAFSPNSKEQVKQQGKSQFLQPRHFGIKNPTFWILTHRMTKKIDST